MGLESVPGLSTFSVNYPKPSLSRSKGTRALIPSSSPKLGTITRRVKNAYTSGKSSVNTLRKKATNKYASLNKKTIKTRANKLANTLSPAVSEEQKGKLTSYGNSASKYLNFAKNLKKMSPKQLVQLGVNTHKEIQLAEERRSKELQKKIKNNWKAAKAYTKKRNANYLSAYNAAEQKRKNSTQKLRTAEANAKSRAFQSLGLTKNIRTMNRNNLSEFLESQGEEVTGKPNWMLQYEAASKLNDEYAKSMKGFYNKSFGR